MENLKHVRNYCISWKTKPFSLDTEFTILFDTPSGLVNDKIITIFQNQKTIIDNEIDKIMKNEKKPLQGKTDSSNPPLSNTELNKNHKCKLMGGEKYVEEIKEKPQFAQPKPKFEKGTAQKNTDLVMRELQDDERAKKEIDDHEEIKKNLRDSIDAEVKLPELPKPNIFQRFWNSF